MTSLTRQSNDCSRYFFHLVIFTPLMWSAVAFADESYDQLIRAARVGSYEPALTALRSIPSSNATSGQISDHLQIAGWAGYDAEVINVYETQSHDHFLTVEALNSTARAYRNIKRWNSAIELYNKGLAIAPQSLDLQLGLAMTLADAGGPSKAVYLTKALVTAKPDDPARRMALAYALTSNRQAYDALFQYDQAFILAGNKPEVGREYVFALQRARLPEPALRLAESRPGLIDAASLRRIEGDLAAEQVRMAEYVTRSEQERYVIADRALSVYDKLLRSNATDQVGHHDVIRWRIDRLGALKARTRTAEVISEYQSLLSDKVEVPTYALRWVAAAYLDQRQPEVATDLYRQVIAAPNGDSADRVEDTTALYYAMLESDRPEEARRLAEDLAKNERPRVELKGLPIGNPNESWMDAQLLAVQSGTSSDDRSSGEARLSALVDQAPGNIGLRVAQADSSLARGWPRRAENQLKEIESLAPRDTSLEVAQGYTAMELQEWRQNDALIDDVVSRFPDNRQVQRLARQRDVHDMAELRVSTYAGHSYGGSSETGAGAVAGSKDFGIESTLYSPPINEDWRVFTGAGYATGNFQEGLGHDRTQRLGVERRTRDLTLEAEVSNHDYGYGGKQGARVAIARDIDDHWQYGGSFDYLSANTPLRALNSEIKANGGSAFLRWRTDDSREWKLAFTPSRFSDGNNRQEALLTGREGLYSASHVQVDLGLEVGTSHNSKSEDVPYFNPKSDLSVLPTVKVNHVLYRRYEHSWRQEFQAGGGTYSQQHYGTGGVFLVGYGQRLAWNDVVDVAGMLTAINRPYDGNRETDLRLLVDLTYRF